MDRRQRVTPPRFAALVALICTLFAAPASAAVVVVANRSVNEVRFELTAGEGKPETHVVSSGDTLAAPVGGPVVLSLAGDKPARFELEPNAAYFSADRAGALMLEQIGLGKSRAPVDLPREAPAVGRKWEVDKNGRVTIPVKILTDDEQPAVRKVWEEQLRGRIKAASDILERSCRVRFEVVAVETWDSDDSLVRFEDSLAEFERIVSPTPARVAIGFTSQYAAPPKTRVSLGGTRGPFHSHVLIREWSQHITEPERLEVLLHELAHELGAIHSPEPNSTMRPLLGDRQARARKFRIGFDPVNILAMNLVADEMRSRGVASFWELSRGTREQLADIYAAVGETLPDDPAARQYIAFLRGFQIRAGQNGPPLLAADDQAAAVRHIVVTVVRAAEENSKRPEARANAAANPAARLAGDDLTAAYIRRAAETARRLPAEHAHAAFLLGLGIALDQSGQLQENAVLRELYKKIESDADRTHRLAVLGKPTILGREDLLSHFVVSAALTELLGDRLAETAGIFKESTDSTGASGFSFVDLTADLAGIAFARRLIEREGALEEWGKGFTVRDYMPDVTGLKEDLPRNDFVRDYGATTDPRFRAELEGIRKRVAALPAHAKSAAPGKTR